MVLKLYKIIKTGQTSSRRLLAVFKNRTKLKEYMKFNKIKGFGKDAIRVGLDKSTSWVEYGKGWENKGYLVVEINKKRHGFTDKFGKFQETNTEVMVKTKKKKLNKKVDLNILTKIHPKEFIFNVDQTIYSILELVKNKIIKDYGKNIRSYKYSVVLHFKNNKLKLYVSTPYVNNYLVLTKLEKLLNETLRKYDTDNVSEILKNITIKAYKIKALKEQNVLGSLNKEVLTGLYKSCITEDNKAFKKFINKHEIKTVSTTKNCFIKAVASSLFPEKTKEQIKKSTDKLEGFSKESRILEDMALMVSAFYKCRIIIYDDSFKEKYVYESGIECNKTQEEIPTARVLIYLQHSYPVFLRKNKFEYNVFKQKYIEQKLLKKDKPKKEPKVEIKTILGAYDFETYNENNIVRPFALGYQYEGLEKPVILFKKKPEQDLTEQFIEDIKQKEANSKFVFYAHNGGKFDLYLMMKTLVAKKYKIMNMINKSGRLISLTILLPRNIKIQFRDSFCLLSESLDKLLEAFDIKTKKLTGTVDYNFTNSENYASEEVEKMFRKYLNNDVEGLFLLMTTYREIIKTAYDLDITGSNLTSAGIARNYFMSQYDPKNTPVYEVDDKSYLELREGYFGGRNEIFNKIGQQEGDKFYYYDFTSEYPYVMLDENFPIGKYTIKEPKNPNKFNPKWFGIVKCEVISTDTTKRPYHGIKENGKLIFKHFKTPNILYLSTEELKYSMEQDLGYSYKFLKVWHYKKENAIFKKIIKKLYQMKEKAEKDNNKALRQAAKIIINSMYGIWGINKFSSESTLKNFSSDLKAEYHFEKLLYSNKLKNFEKVEGLTYFVENETEIKAKCSNIILAMFITSKARTLLYKLMSDLEKKGTIYYADTDSIITNVNLLKNAPLKKKWKLKAKKSKGYDKINLGDLTNETNHVEGYFTELIILGLKTYYLKSPTYGDVLKFKGYPVKKIFDERIINEEDKEIKYKGLSGNGKFHINRDDYIKVAKGYTLILDNFNFTTGLKNEDMLQYRENVKKMRRYYDKGEIDKDDKIKPFFT